MSTKSQVSCRELGPMGGWLLARMPGVCQTAFEALGWSGRSKHVAPLFASKVLFETLEPRLLLSADLVPAASALIHLDDAYAAGGTVLSLTEDPAGSGRDLVRVSMSPEAAASADGGVDAGWWRLDLAQGDVVSLSVDTPESDMDPYLSLIDASGREIAADDNSGPGNDASISQQEILLTGTYYVQVRAAGEEARSGPYELLIERTRVTQPESARQVGNDAWAAMDAAAFDVQPASVLLAHWVGGSGNRSDPTHWDIGVVPNDSVLSAMLREIPALAWYLGRPVTTVREACPCHRVYLQPPRN